MDLLTNCSQVVDKVLDTSDEMLQAWADLPLVTAVCEAMKQMHMRQNINIEHFWIISMCYQIVC